MKGNHDRRMERLEEMIEERRQRVDDHKSGRRRLSDEEFDLASRQIQNFQRKLESMKSRTDSVSGTPLSVFQPESATPADFRRERFNSLMLLASGKIAGPHGSLGRSQVLAQHQTRQLPGHRSSQASRPLGCCPQSK
jgi:hypothetical protein